MKKIIQIGGNLRINGISSFIMTLYRNLHEEYQFVFVNTAEGNDFYRNEIEALGGKVYDVIVKGKGVVRALRQAKAIRRIIKIEKPCAVHSHYYSNNGLYLKQAYLENVPVRISHCHQSNPDNLSLGKKIAKGLSSILIEKYATRKFACSDKAREFLYGKSGEVCYNAVPYDRFNVVGKNAYTQFGLDKTKKYYLFVARFAPQKNIDFLLNLFLQLKDNEDIVLIMVGYGPKQQEITDFIKVYNLNNIVVLPPYSDVCALLSISNAFLLPSLYEGLPITLIEAQATGTPCFVSDVVTKEVQLGLIQYLSLDVDIWKTAIVNNAKELIKKEVKKCDKFSDIIQAALFRGIYDGLNSNDWIVWGKEYSIGSKTKYRSKYLSEVCFEQSHNLGNVRGTFYYALGYFEGNGVDKNITFAREMVMPIVSEIENKAKNERSYTVILADMYSFGLGKEQDYAKAYELYQKAAKEGNLEAMCDLGYMYQIGQGVELDLQQSAYWYKKSADLGYVHSMRDIGQSYLQGLGAEKSPTDATRYFEMASSNNYSHGTGDLAYCYLKGIGVEQNFEKAAKLYKLALLQDDERTMRDLFAVGIEVNALKSDNRIVMLTNTGINEISGNNAYAGTLCIADRISYVNASCLYDSNVKKVFVEKDNKYYCAKGGVLFNKDKTTLVRFAPKSTDTEYTIPDGVTKVGAHAFQNCKNLRRIILPNSLIEIDDSAFDDCKNLECIEFPSSLKSIGNWAFHGCDKVKSFSIPSGVSNIGTYAFGSCESLEKITVDTDNIGYCSLDGNLYDKRQTVLLQYAIAKSEQSFELPKSVNRIAFRAVSDAYNLCFVNLSNCIRIEDKAFYYCTSLKNAVMKEGLQMGEKVFEHTAEGFKIEVIK